MTGGAGFIGSALVRRLIANTPHNVVNLDKLTYAGNLDSLASVCDSPKYSLERADIADGRRVREVFSSCSPSAVIHLAAESHVDRSIDGPADFIQTNVVGTFTLLEESLRYWRDLPARRRSDFRFVHVSTDEVFGSLGPEGCFTETSAYSPRSPYSASKAASDHLARAWFHTYELPVIVTNCSNNYGPYQFPEKLVPLMIQNALHGRPLPLYGDGENIRDWLFVDDHADALMLVADKGMPGETYAIGGRSERRNIDVVREICRIVDELAPPPDLAPRDQLIRFVGDRPGHDRRYAVDSAKLERELGWRPSRSFESGLRATVEWHLNNQAWCDRVLSGAYRGERLGLGIPT